MADSVLRTESNARADRAGTAAPSAIGARLASIAAVVRRLIGVPDYDTYLLHMRERYPQCTPMDRAAFERDRLTARYQRLGSRCC
jgi:uncharacterized short protein YbdD (DUF466 family)